MTETTKNVNYSAELTAEIVADYTSGMTVEAIAEKTGKGVRSIVAKLSREGVYKAKAHEAKAARVKKDELVARIAELVGKDEEVMSSLEKATGVALNAILAALEANASE